MQLVNKGGLKKIEKEITAIFAALKICEISLAKRKECHGVRACMRKAKRCAVRGKRAQGGRGSHGMRNVSIRYTPAKCG